MPLAKRIIVSLLTDGQGNCLKPMSFGRPARPVGSLMQAIRVCTRRDIDELCLIDILATEQQRKPDFTKIREYASEISCPLMVGGGIKTLDDVKAVLDNGGDTVLLHKVFPSFVAECNNAIGRANVAINLVLSELNILGMLEDDTPGQFVVTDDKRDGTMSGYDLDTIARFARRYGMPVVANGGCGTPNDMHLALTCGADAVMAGSMFLFTETTPKQAAKFLKSKGHEVRCD